MARHFQADRRAGEQGWSRACRRGASARFGGSTAGVATPDLALTPSSTSLARQRVARRRLGGCEPVERGWAGFKARTAIRLVKSDHEVKATQLLVPLGRPDKSSWPTQLWRPRGLPENWWECRSPASEVVRTKASTKCYGRLFVLLSGPADLRHPLSGGMGRLARSLRFFNPGGELTSERSIFELCAGGPAGRFGPGNKARVIDLLLSKELAYTGVRGFRRRPVTKPARSVR